MDTIITTAMQPCDISKPCPYKLIHMFQSLTAMEKRVFCRELIDCTTTNEIHILRDMFYIDFVSKLPLLPLTTVLSYLDDRSLNNCVQVSKRWFNRIYSLPKILRRRCSNHGISYQSLLKSKEPVLSQYLSITNYMDNLQNNPSNGLHLKSKYVERIKCACSVSEYAIFESEMLHWCSITNDVYRQVLPFESSSLAGHGYSLGLQGHYSEGVIRGVDLTKCNRHTAPNDSDVYQSGGSPIQCFSYVPSLKVIVSLDTIGNLFVWKQCHSTRPQLPCATREVPSLSNRLWWQMKVANCSIQDEACLLVFSCHFAIAVVYLQMDKNCSSIVELIESPQIESKVINVVTFQDRIVLSASGDNAYSVKKFMWHSDFFSNYAPIIPNSVKEQSSINQYLKTLDSLSFNSNLCDMSLVAAGESIFLLSGKIDSILHMDIYSYESEECLWRLPIVADLLFEGLSTEVMISILGDVDWLNGITDVNQVKTSRFIIFFKKRYSPSGHLMRGAVGFQI